ncbi:FMN-binding negative transcriptional regulator [Oceanobacillus piezotolerans]|uniref:FMN-binding negative transcriptional regulator n=1 Tax=Oceanobacillus piezotolerans TaxID=2448030 RepID=A0A498DDG4_9BACI|nr:FMN-binding negative transcriptional regulator [Oceanobacillus piezotolerans]RLL47007.1 FMN-binding negative transcriptional regulator [Oceanobacillus piezotolerans]
MFIPKHFRVTDFNEIREFIQKNSFGTVVTTKDGVPIATHVPLQLRKEGDDFYITGHLAYANPQWKTFDAENENVLVMFQGPHAYISSSWYKHENVPTWNYQSVHVYGPASLMNEHELEEDLRLLLQRYETSRENPVLWGNLKDQTKKQMRGIVGFKIKVQEVFAAYKLSQNRTAEDYHNIMDRLFEEEDIISHHIAEVMKNRGSFR